MQLTRFTDLGLRAVMLLAAGEADGRRVTTGSIAAGANASENHIAKAVARLSDLGLVSARRGRVGGLTLTDEGRNASIGWLVRRLEGDREVVECGGSAPCPLVPACRLRRALADAKEAFYRELDHYTVNDLARGATLPLLAVPAKPEPPHPTTERTDHP
ncbi:Rrf2 family transcriptional regulator [uncultured Mycolicibacterium sp.]|uniref:RrF2 family transcriptional regulator n=1 Tax=uncultured Mycolicibacterium sp. TaxID=2320817 RepID=UPI0032B163DB|tara:strand:- start:149 stop:625 length:477 start_codon:yes stop_codon:yes gene_type:complete